MNTYFISFRISDQSAGGKTYDERRDLLIAAARRAEAGFWDGTTSFFIAQSNMSTFDFAASLASGLAKSVDMLVVFDPSDMSLAHFGAVSEPDILESFFDFKKKL